jgi:hypothetical protein
MAMRGRITQWTIPADFVRVGFRGVNACIDNHSVYDKTCTGGEFRNGLFVRQQRGFYSLSGAVLGRMDADAPRVYDCIYYIGLFELKLRSGDDVFRVSA